MQEFFEQFLENIKQTPLIVFIAVVFGIVSVLYSRKENLLVYPTGLINTILSIYICFESDLIGEASVNFYYTAVSFYGWWLWAKKDQANKPVVRVTFSNRKEWVQEIIFFLFCYITLFFILTYLKQYFEGAIPSLDAFASATAYTGMWLMARKKVESWWWWILTNIASIWLFYVKDFALFSVYYIVLLVLAIFGLLEWRRRAKAHTGLVVKRETE